MYKLFVWQGQFAGGAGRITHEFASYVAHRGIQVTLGVFQTSSNSPLNQIAIGVPSFIPQSFRSLFASIIFRIRYARSFDGVYAHTLGMWKTKRAHLFIHDAADLGEKLRHEPPGLAKIAYWIWRWLYIHLCLRRADLLLSGSLSFTSYLARIGIPQQKIASSGSFYDTHLFRYVKRVKPSIPYRLIFVGDYTDAAKQFSVIEQQLVGDTRYKIDVAGGQKRPREHNITYHGYVPPKQLYVLLSRADIYVMPSRSEGFSIALLEALATGIPCLVYNASVPPELMEMHNIMAVESLSDIDGKVEQIVQQYVHYSHYGPAVEKFSKLAVLEREWAALQPYLTQ